MSALLWYRGCYLQRILHIANSKGQPPWPGEAKSPARRIVVPEWNNVNKCQEYSGSRRCMQMLIWWNMWHVVWKTLNTAGTEYIFAVPLFSYQTISDALNLLKSRRSKTRQWKYQSCNPVDVFNEPCVSVNRNDDLSKEMVCTPRGKWMMNPRCCRKKFKYGLKKGGFLS